MTMLLTTIALGRASRSVAGRSHEDAANRLVRHSGVDLAQVSIARWHALLTEFADLSFEQNALFAAGAWGERRVSCLDIACRGETIGGACAVILALPLELGGVAYIKHGPVWRRRAHETNPETYRTIVSALIEEFAERRGKGIVVVPRPHPVTYPIERQVLAELGFRVRRPPADPNRYLVDVSLDEDAQLASVGRTWRRNLQAALAGAIDVSETADLGDVAAFAGLHAAMVRRKCFADKDRVDLVPALLTALPAELRPRLFLARHRDRPVAGAVIGVQGDVAYYLYGATNSEALPLRAGFALQWAIIRWLKGQSARWYDLGGEAGEPGLQQFKKGLVGRRGVVIATDGEYEYAPDRNARLAIDLVMAARSARRTLMRQLAHLG